MQLLKSWKGNLAIPVLSILLLVSILPTNYANAVTYTYTVLGVKNYNATWLNDLSNDDMWEFSTKLDNLSWTKYALFEDQNVWDTDFVNFGQYSDILYFTGHGDSQTDQLCLQDYGVISPPDPRRVAVDWNDIGNGWIGWDDVANHDIEWAIFAACNVLQNNNWGKVLANGAHHIFGYKGVSSENHDEGVARWFVNRAWGDGFTPQTLVNAWRNTNIAWEENNWAITGHKGNEGDYAHGINTGATTDIGGTSDIYHWSASGNFYLAVPKNAVKIDGVPIIGKSSLKLNQLDVLPENLNYDAIISGMLGKNYNYKLGDNNSQFYQDNKGTVVIYPSGGISYEHTGSMDPVTITKEQAANKAEEFINANGGMPTDAYLDEVMPQILTDQTGEDQVIGYLMTYRHSYDNIRIQGQAGDSIKVLVDNSGVSFYQRLWRKVAAKLGSFNGSISASNALEVAKRDWQNAFKGSLPEIKSMELVYWSQPFLEEQTKMKLAWKVSNGSHAMYIDAQTGARVDKDIIR